METVNYKQYLNDAQAHALLMDPKNLIAELGRGTGKGLIQAKRMLSCAQLMPGSSCGFVSPTIKRCLTNTLPSMTIHLERWGFKRDVHYCIGKRPPKKLHWRDPILTPANWENTISFYTGTVVPIISQDRSGTSNSLSLDHLILDEAKFIDYEQLKDETLPANRGNQLFFGSCHLHHGITITSDASMTKKGSWFYRYEKEQDKELILAIETLVRKRWQILQRIDRHPERSSYYRAQLDALDRRLSDYRSACTLYLRYSSIVNLAVLGEEYIRRMKRDLPFLTFMVSIMCKHVNVSLDGFYNALREEVNLYTAANRAYLESLGYDFQRLTKQDCRMDADVEPDKPLIIAFDANALINWLVVGQLGKDGRLRILKSFFTKYEKKLPELVQLFLEYYHYHRCHRVIFYYDATFVGNNYASHADDFHTLIEKQLRAAQWMVIAKYIGRPMAHIEKNLLVNRMFKGQARHQVLINRENNEDLLISIQSAGVRNGMEKDKSGEKLAETEEDRLESRTDGSDAFDTVCIGTERFPVAGMIQGMSNDYS
ncbi:MAG: hypothetical protein J6C65_01825 [Prevotella sp.]|nr:hypothetical protein [Prevotella sp.]MBO5204757.1 hypothetical protein [Prevotella sp.]